jgi:hypothetical protein
MDLQHPHAQIMLYMSTEYYVRRPHSHCVDVVAFRKIAFVEEDRLETDVRSASIGMDAIDSHEVLRGYSFGIGRILVCFSTALVPQLQLRHLHWLVSAQSVGYAFTCAVGVTPPVSRESCSIVETQRLDDVNRDNVSPYPCEAAPARLLQLPRAKHISDYSSCAYSMIIQ